MNSIPQISQAIIDATRSVTGDGEHQLHIPDLTDQDRNSVSTCFDEGFVSSAGSKIALFEQKLKDYTGAKHAIALSSGTAALHVALIASGVRSNDEVLVPALTFVATGNAILYCGAVPHFIESKEAGFGIDPNLLHEYLDDIVDFNDRGEAINRKTGRVIRALTAVHIFGHITDIQVLKDLASKFNLLLIEDAAEALGSWEDDTHAGLHGNAGALSFNGNKIITTGGGGCLLTNCDKIALQARHISTTAKLSHPYNYYHDQIGYNYRMPNLNAALGLSQIRRLEMFLGEKAQLRDAYRNAFAHVEECNFYTHNKTSTSNYWLQTIVLEEENIDVRNYVIEQAHQQGLFMRPIWNSLNSLPAFVSCPSMELDTTHSLINRSINIPSSCYLGRLHG